MAPEHPPRAPGLGPCMQLSVIGATGFVGRRLVPHLAADGHRVVAMARHLPETPLSGADAVLAVDVADEDAMAEALTGSAAAYYLVHSMTGADFRARDLALATTFGRAAARAGVGRIVYLGALGDDPGSEHLASRQEVGAALASAGVPVVELRAAVVVGSGSISFEMLRYLTERLPFMVCPRWVRTRLQPIATRDLLTYLRERIKEVLTGASGSVVVRLYGPDTAVLREKAKAVEAAMKDVPGVTNLKVEPQVLVAQIDQVSFVRNFLPFLFIVVFLLWTQRKEVWDAAR